MIQFDNLKIKKLAVHKVGNKILDEGVEFSTTLADIKEENLLNLIKQYFLSSFSGNEIYNFHNTVGLEQNEMYVVAKQIFTENSIFFNQTKLIAKHLYENSNHPKIKNGELYISYFEDLVYNNELVNAIGVFKSETKENYIKSNIKSATEIISYDEGTRVNKLDKGCIILNVDEDSGYRVCIIDNLGKNSESVYWKDNFLSIKPIKNEFHNTNQILNITKQFFTKQIPEELEISKADQIDLLNRSINYFKTHEQFNQQDFEEEVLNDNGVIESFRDFNEFYQKENEIEVADNFEISNQAVKKQARAFKRVLKLDKNFHIYIHGNRDLIEKGVDEKGRKYYKIFYEEEK